MHASITLNVRKIDDYNISYRFRFYIFHFRFCHIRRQCLTHWLKKKKEKIKTTTIMITATTTTTKRKWLFKSRILNVYILINIALFIYSNEKTLIIITEIWNLIWRCMKSVKIFVIAFTSIIFAISKSSFAFIKRIYMMLTSSNKHLQTIKRAK